MADPKNHPSEGQKLYSKPKLPQKLVSPSTESGLSSQTDQGDAGLRRIQQWVFEEQKRRCDLPAASPVPKLAFVDCLNGRSSKLTQNPYPIKLSFQRNHHGMSVRGKCKRYYGFVRPSPESNAASTDEGPDSP